MTWLKAHWKALAVTLALLLAVVWYSRPVDIYTQIGRASCRERVWLKV